MDSEIEQAEIIESPQEETAEELHSKYLERKEKGEFAISDLLEMVVEGLTENERLDGLTAPTDEELRHAQIDTYNFALFNKILTTRVDNRAGKINARVVTCLPTENGHFRPIEGAEIFTNCEDPAVTQIHGKYITSMVKTYGEEGNSHCKTKFYMSDGDLTKKELFAEGQEDEKDIRLQELDFPSVGVFRRPKDKEYGDGQIGWQTTSDISENLKNTLSDNNTMKIIKKFATDEWGGMNDSRMLDNGKNKGKIFFVGHMAKFDRPKTDPEKKKDYYGTAGIFNPETEEIESWEIIVDEEAIAALAAEQGIVIEPKNEQMGSVCYISSIINIDEENGLVTLGISVQDTKSFEATLKVPIFR